MLVAVILTVYLALMALPIVACWLPKEPRKKDDHDQ